MKFFQWVLFYLLLLSCGAMAKLPAEVTEFLEEQKFVFDAALAKLTEQQQTFLFERYAEVLNESPAVSQFKIDKKELLEYLAKHYPVKKPVLENKFKTSATGQEEIQKLLSAFKGVRRENVLDLNIACRGHNYLLPFEVVTKYDLLELQLIGIGIPDALGEVAFDHHCLKIEFDSDKKNLTIGWLGTRKTVCPIPAEKAGECLLSVAESFAKATERSRVSLQDQSEVMCLKNRKPVNFTRLKIYQEGQGWYQKQGYVPERNSAKYYSELEKFKNYQLKEFSIAINQFKATTKDGRLISRAKDFIQQYFDSKEKGTGVRDFMSWLWKTDCPAYIKLDEFLFERHKEFEIVRIYPKAGNLKKDL